MNLRDLVDAINAPGALYGEIAGPDGMVYYIELQKRDLLAQMRGRYAVDGKPNYKAETGMMVDASVATARLLTVQKDLSWLGTDQTVAPADPVFEDVSVQELAREAMDDAFKSGETERNRLIVEAAMRRKKGIADATAFVDRTFPRPAYMVDAVAA